jgi:predicted nucleotidyltransferase
VALLQGRSDLTVALSGSLVSGRIDRYSDLDFEIIIHPGTITLPPLTRGATVPDFGPLDEVRVCSPETTKKTLTPSSCLSGKAQI